MCVKKLESDWEKKTVESPICSATKKDNKEEQDKNRRNRKRTKLGSRRYKNNKDLKRDFFGEVERYFFFVNDRFSGAQVCEFVPFL